MDDHPQGQAFCVDQGVQLAALHLLAGVWCLKLTITNHRRRPGDTAARLAGRVGIPPGKPQTKPRALNCALARATGDLLTVYDAEDEPDPLQLR